MRQGKSGVKAGQVCKRSAQSAVSKCSLKELLSVRGLLKFLSVGGAIRSKPVLGVKAMGGSPTCSAHKARRRCAKKEERRI